MKTKNKFPGFFSKLVHFFSSKAVRNITILILIVCSTFAMFLLDETNIIRDEHLTFLNDNFISKIMSFFKIPRYNLTIASWVIYFCVALIAAVLVIGDIFSGLFINERAEDNVDNFKSIESAKRFYGAIYYTILFLIAAVIVFLFIMLGGLKLINMNNANIFISLLYTLLICFAFLLIIPITVFLIYFAISAVLFIIAFILSKISSMSKDISGEKKNETPTDNEAHQPANRSNFEYGSVQLQYASPTLEETAGKDIFLPLTLIDQAEKPAPTVNEDISLEELALRFQSFASNNHKIYYELPIIRSYLAGLAASRLIILEGLSGTGKSMLPRMFAQFTSSNASFTPVQATWRDKTDLLGFYSEFSKNFKTTDFLKNLYAASYSDKMTEMVLDEVNLSRIEYYFADFLSIMEYPISDWKINIYQPEANQTLPEKLTDGYISIPNNTWFIGTANTDDSTFTITDKVYDRAIVIDFSERFSPISSKYSSAPINISSDKLLQLFEDAKNNDSYRLSAQDMSKFISICEFTKDAFEIKFGNRIMVQIESFVPVYVALGGTKEEALDFMFARKILRKLNGAYQDYVKEELVKLKSLIDHTYGKGVFKETELLIAKITKRLV